MICEQCRKEKPQEDFFKQNICYSCEYKKKLSASPDKKHKTCRNCHKPIPETRSKRALNCSAFCSLEDKKNYWTRKINFIRLPQRLNYGEQKLS